jgi:type II secretory pathway pseudopilin PulG
VELIVVVSIMGILASLAMAAYRGVTEATERGVAQSTVDRLNGAVAKYSQISWTFDVAADDDSGDDELLVLRSLQWRDAGDPAHGSPYYEPTWDPSTSDDIETHRIRWNGRGYTLLEPDTAGTGLRVRFDGLDQGQTVDFGDFYSPVAPSG